MRAAALVLLLCPMALAATDPIGDVEPCSTRPGEVEATGIDLVEAEGEVAELGTSAVWRLTFAEPLRESAASEPKYRVDVVVRDPDLPRQGFGSYVGLNRLVRFNAGEGDAVTIILVPEHARERFSPPESDGRTMTIRVPGRILSADEDDSGTNPGLARLRWGVVVRAGGTCDRLGGGQPVYRFTIPAVSPSVAPGVETGSAGDPFVPVWLWWAGAGCVAVAAAYGFRRRAGAG